MAEYDNKVLTGEQLGVFSGLVKTAINEKQDELVFNTAYNSTSNKVATMADIPAVPVNVSAFTNDAGYQNASQVSAAITAALPAPYVLPTASDTVLGGVKIDGTTITINDGVISASGASYTAGDGINIDSNNVINRNSIDFGEPLFTVLGSGLISNFSLGTNIGSYSSVANLAVALKQNKIAGTSASFGYTSFSIKDLNDAMGTSYTGRKFSIDFTNSSPITSTYYAANSTANINSNSRLAIALMIVGNEIWCVNNGISGLRQLFGFNLSQILQLKTNNVTNYTNSRLDQAIYQLDTAITNKLTVPTAPSADGSYKLTSTITSGTASYAWTADTASFSGSYNDLTDKPTIPAAYTLPTASTSELGGVKVDGTTITITDGVISAVTSGGGGGASDAEDVAYDNTTSGLTATDAQAAIDEIVSKVTGFKRPLRVITVQCGTNNSYTPKMISQTNGVSMYGIEHISTNILFPTQDDYNWAREAAYSNFYEYPFLFDIVYGTAPLHYIIIPAAILSPSWWADDEVLKKCIPSISEFLIFGSSGMAPIYLNSTATTNSTYRFIKTDSGYGARTLRNYGSGYNCQVDLIWCNTFHYENPTQMNYWFSAQLNSFATSTVNSNNKLATMAELPTGLPTAPTTDGDYVLKVSVADGTPTYSWVAAT